MKLSGRISLTILILGLILLLGILFRSTLMEYLVRPIAILIWYVWRILSSVDQVFYWRAASILALIYIFFSLFLRQLRKLTVLEPTAPPSSNATLENISYWRTTILVTQDEIETPNILKRNLGNMLASMYASKQSETSTWEVFDGLKLRRIPLPDPIYAFLFPGNPLSSPRTFRQILQTIWQTPQNWLRKWTKQDLTEYYQKIDQVVAFMESAMEIKYEPDSFETDKH
jgi:hypothetical protein